MDELLKEKREVIDKMRAMINKAKDEKRDFTEDEDKEYNELKDQRDSLSKKIEREKDLADEEKRMSQSVSDPVKPEPDDGESREIEVGEDREAKAPFESLGHFMQAVARSSTPGNATDKRLLESQAAEERAAGTGSLESVPSEGGFLVGTDYSNEIIKRVYENNQVLQRCSKRVITSGANSIKVNAIDETSRVDGSRYGGVRAYWEGEVDQMTESRPKFSQVKLEPFTLTELYYASDRILEDASILMAEVNEAFEGEMDFKIQDGLINGDGAGKPMGVMNANCLIPVTKETGQGAATIIYDNIVNMWARAWGKSRPNLIWLINQDIEPQLQTMSLAVGTGGVPVYMPAGGASASPYGSLYGRPVIPIEQCQTLGTTGDIILGDFTQYIVATKGTLRRDMSIHLKFDYNQTAFRWILRLDGQPRWKTALTPYKGTNTQGPFIVLETRS